MSAPVGIAICGVAFAIQGLVGLLKFGLKESPHAAPADTLNGDVWTQSNVMDTVAPSMPVASPQPAAGHAQVADDALAAPTVVPISIESNG